MREIYAVKTTDSGRALIGRITIDVESLTLQAMDHVDKNPGDSADPHHPEVPILLEILDGTHNIFVAADGSNEQTVELQKGDLILFVDFKPEVPPVEDQEYSYAGHRSVVGPTPARLNPAKVQSEVSLESWRAL